MNYPQLARISLKHFLQTGRRLPAEPHIGTKAGCFISIHEKSGALRGCIGTIAPTQSDLSAEIIENAISAGTRDPRFAAISEDELPNLVFEVSVLNEPEPISGPELLDVKRYGVIVESGRRRGLLLPDLDGVDSIAQQISIARRKAMIGEHEAVQLWRFEVIKHHESD